MVLGVAAALFYAVFIARCGFSLGGRLGFTLFDDAMISMRYARNLAEGHGLVWNPGERVEGYSNPLWTLWMALIHATGVSDERASLLVMVSGAGLLLATDGGRDPHLPNAVITVVSELAPRRGNGADCGVQLRARHTGRCAAWRSVCSSSCWRCG